MNRSEIIDILYLFIKDHFKECYWKNASGYLYSSSQFGRHTSYNNFLLHQEITLYEKSYDELNILIGIVNMIQQNNIKIMNFNQMHPEDSYCIVFDMDGTTIITSKK